METTMNTWPMDRRAQLSSGYSLWMSPNFRVRVEGRGLIPTNDLQVGDQLPGGLGMVTWVPPLPKPPEHIWDRITDATGIKPGQLFVAGGFAKPRSPEPTRDRDYWTFVSMWCKNIVQSSVYGEGPKSGDWVEGLDMHKGCLGKVTSFDEGKVTVKYSREGVVHEDVLSAAVFSKAWKKVER